MDTNVKQKLYQIPPNFESHGMLLGGTIRLRNAIEAALLALGTMLPLWKLPLSFQIRIMLMLIVSLPLAVFAAIGVEGESLSEFALTFLSWLFRRRILNDREHAPKKKKYDFRKPPLCEDFFPIAEIRNGTIITKDRRYLRILEVEPVNFLLRSPEEQRAIVESFAEWLKISPVRLQMKVVTRKADLKRHLRATEQDMERETSTACRALQEDYRRLLCTIGSREAVSRRFLLIFEAESISSRRQSEEELLALLDTATETARQYLRRSDNDLVRHEDEDAFLREVLKEITKSASPGFLPRTVDLRPGAFFEVDGTYRSILCVTSGGYRPLVSAGWTGLFINAGEGIDVDFFFTRQPSELMRAKLGQQIRINRSRLKDTSDTNTDHEDFESAVTGAYQLKEGMRKNEDFYYLSTFLTVSASSREELTWRTQELMKLLSSRDITARVLNFRQEKAFLSTLPLCRIDPKLEKLSRRNLLTMAAASTYPFTSFEMSDENGILLGVNRFNRSLVIVDIFNSRAYKNANMVLLGTSGAGKTFTLQLLALRMRRKGIRVFIIAPLKGHEFKRACDNIGGEFISISPASGRCINVMEIRRLDRTADELLDGGEEMSLLARKIQQLHIFFSLLIPDMNHEERQLLDEALIETYAQKGITHDNVSLIHPHRPDEYKPMPLLGDVHALLMAREETRRLGNILSRLVSGSAKTFSRQTNVNLENLYTVLDISGLSGELLSIGMFVALDYVWDVVRQNRTEEKAVFIDEAWELIGADDAPGERAMAGSWVREIFKTIRGYGGAAIAATQDIGDFDRSKYGKGILNVARTKIILNLEEEEARRVQHSLRLSETEVTGVTRFERGQGLLCANANHVSVSFKASPLETELITTDRRELKNLLDKKRKTQESEELS